MKKKLNIVFIASECVPFAKTGGLADVAGSLPIALKKRGHKVCIVMPKYSFIDKNKFGLKRFMAPMGVWMGDQEEWCSVDVTYIDDDIPVYFIEHNLYFNREGLYHDGYFRDYQDNPKRFGFLSRAGLQLCRVIKFKADIIHSHDWHTALCCAYQKIWHWNDPVIGKAASILTIHNINYQGAYPADIYDYLGLQWQNFTSEKFEDHGNINFLKGGIQYADVVNTVSPSYKNETKSPEGGKGLALFLNDKHDNYEGILNGIDYSVWDPDTDKIIPANYNIKDLSGKKICKKKLQERFGLQEGDNIPIIGLVSRFVHQKGVDVLAGSIEPILKNMKVQFVILGSGEKKVENQYNHLAWKYPGRIGVYIGYNDELAHWIEAGTDFFIMPSRFEPCGLNQIYSLKYGSLPIVRATGGLNDTVEQYNEETGEGTGFKFWDLTVNGIYYTVGWAVSTYYDRPKHMKKMIKNAMKQHFSWDDSALKYEELYYKAIKNKLG